MSATQDFVALDWIKTEISEILEQAQHSLERAVESEDGPGEMRACLSAVHQIHGTLKMVQIEGPVSVAREMEELAEALMNNAVPDTSQAQEILMQTILQMPGYLDRIQREQKDSPEFFKPAINNLMIARGAEGIALDSLKVSDQFILLSQATSEATLSEFQILGGENAVRKLRQHYQKSLSAVLKNNKVKENLVQVGKVFSKLIKICGDSPLGNLSQLGIALIEGVVSGGIKLDGSIVRQLKLIDASLKIVVEGKAGEDTHSLSIPISDGLGQDIYAALKGSSKETPKVTLALAKFDAETPQSELSVEHVEFGPDDDTLAAVSKILIEEIVSITDSLDLYVRSSNRDASDLYSLVPPLSQVSSTLSVVGLTDHQQSINEQIETINQLQTDGADPSEDQLLHIAGALLKIQAELGKMAGNADGESESIGDLNEAQAAVIRETRISLAKCKDSLINYVSNDFAKEHVDGLSEALRNLRGGLLIANQQRSADVLESCANYVTEVLVVKSDVPKLSDMDDLADAITSIDYYLERFLESSSDPYLQMVEVAEEAIEKLGYAVSKLGADQNKEDEEDGFNDTIVTQLAEDLNQTVVQASEFISEEEEDSLSEIEEPTLDSVEDVSQEEIEELEETSEETLGEEKEETGEDEVAAEQDLEELGLEELGLEEVAIEEDDLIDDEIKEIFIEEAEEVLETIGEYLPQWQSDHGNEEARTEIRRAFHTLKGSGRMVGATVVGEMAWSIESMLNRVIENTIPLTDELLNLVAEVVTRVPEGIEAFKENNQTAFDPSELVTRAEAISAGVTATEVEEEPSADIEPSAKGSIEESAIDEERPDETLSNEIDEPLDLGEPELEALDLEEPVLEETDLDAIEAESPDLEDLELESLELENEMGEEPSAYEEPSAEEETLVEDLALDELSLESETSEPSDLEDLELEDLELNDELSNELSAFEGPSVDDSLDEDESLDLELKALSLDAGSLQADTAAYEIEDELLELDEPETEEAFSSEDSETEEFFAELEDVNLDKLSEEAEEDVTAAPVEVDSELDEIFKEEALENLSVVRAFSGGKVPSEVVAAFHTLKGSAGMAEVSVIADIASPMEALSVQKHASGEETDEQYQNLLNRSLELMEFVLIDLSNRRSHIEPLEEFLSQFDDIEKAEKQAVFEFDQINALSKQVGDSDDWDEARVAELIDELKIVQDQAEVCNQVALGEFATAMLSVYAQIQSKPSESVTNLLNRAHESLIIIFDHIASSQDVIVDDQLLNDLLNLDIESETAKQELSDFVDDCLSQIENINESLGSWSNDLANLLPLEQISAQLSNLESEAESHNVSEVSNLSEAMLAFCESLSQGQSVPNEEDISLVENGCVVLSNLLRALVSGELVSTDEILGAIRNRIEGSGLSAQTDDSTLLPADEIEDDILPIFIEEAEEICESIDESILAWGGDTSSSAHLDNLLRHLHTIKGGARLAGLNSLGEYTHNFETFLIGVQRNPTNLDDHFFALLNTHQDEIARRVAIYSKVLTGEATEAELASMRNSGAEVVDVVESDVESADEQVLDNGEDAAVSIEVTDLPEDDIDEEILSIFIEEAEELIEALDQSILDWSNNPETNDHYDNLLRHLHTMKGGSRLAGLNSLGEYTHNFETYLIGVQQNPVPFDEHFFAGLNKHQDEITRRVEVYQKHVQGEASAEELSSMSQAEQISAPTDQKDVIESAKPVTASAAMATAIENTVESVAIAPAAQAQEMVRVSADLLEDLISLSGEANITRGRIEQQITDFGESLQEMEDTINRIREQVRRLEIEAESRETVLRNNNTVGDSDSQFDELEMDRYTMLQEISRTLNESSSDMAGLKDTLVNKSRDAETLLHQQARIGSELQEGLTRTRMVPISRLIPRLRRIVRQVSAEVGKSVRFDAFNVEGELDRNVLERIVAPLEHMLRNAVDHGIETTDERLSANKPETGRISMRLSREGGYVLLTISDDGAGINVDVVKRKAIERGIITEDSDVTDQDVMQFIMHAGFSTAAKLTQISGRGVGMDVVGSEIKQLGGSVTIDSTFGVGTEFTIRIPFTVSINRALMVIVKGETFAVPLNTIEGIVRVSPYELEAYYQPDAPMFEYAGQPYVLNYMGEMLDKEGGPILEGQVALLPVILARSGDESVALQVDRVIGSREVVVKTLGPQFNEVGGISGATVLGDGRVVIILDVMALVRNYKVRNHNERKSEDDNNAVREVEIAEPVNRARKIMIVDDSVTVRKVTTRLMERQGWEVTTAKDGVDAINQLQDYYPDIMLLDIEMPKMDGFGVLSAVRRDSRLEKLPIIMITSRTGEKHKQQAFELGVNQYLGKPFQEANLISTIDAVIEEANAND